MGLAAPQVQATIVWPRATDEVPANASVWIRVTTIRAVAQLGLEVDGAAVETDVTLRHQAPAPPWPSVPMPPGWVPSPPHALYELRPRAPWTPGARASAFVHSVAVNPEPAPPPHVRSVDEPVANAVHQVEVARVDFLVTEPRAPGAARVWRPGADEPAWPSPFAAAQPPGAPTSPFDAPAGEREVVRVELDDAPAFVVAAGSDDVLLERPGGYDLRLAAPLRDVAVWSWAGTRMGVLR